MTDRLSVSAIVTAVTSGATTAGAIMADVLARLESYDQVQPQAWISRFSSEQLRAAAAAVDLRVAAGEKLPLAGVPFAVKDNIDVAGLPTTAACPDFAYAPAQNAFVVQKLIDAGAVPIGKTNLDQFATGLVGTRSPHGAPRCVFNLDYISGGSSSGSSVAVAAGLAAFALGTDTAGSGRVPAAFNHLIGHKPSKGRWSSRGLVPACRSLDCISLFTNSADDARLVDDVAAGFDPDDDFSRDVPERAIGMRIGVPLAHQRNFCGDAQSDFLYGQALDTLRKLGFSIIEIDTAVLHETAALLYSGPWVSERTAAVKTLLAANPDAIDPVVRSIVEGGQLVSGVDVFEGQYRLAHLARKAAALWDRIDVMAFPTTPTIYRVRELVASPLALNANLGFYTNFVNLLDMAAVAVPAGFRHNKTGFGITFIAPAGTDRALLDLAGVYGENQSANIPKIDKGDHMEIVKLAVVGAHLKDMPLHWQLTSRNAVFIEETKTASTYRLYAIANSTPPKPALIYDESGGDIAVEVYELTTEAFGSFTAEVPAPLAIGTVTLADGSSVKGFVAEPRATIGAQDITQLGGWRAFVAAAQ